MSDKPQPNTAMLGLMERIEDHKRIAKMIGEVERNSTSLVNARTRLEAMAWVVQQQQTEIQRRLDELVAEITHANAQQKKQKEPK